jgi:hypothetical protein
MASLERPKVLGGIPPQPTYLAELSALQWLNGVSEKKQDEIGRYILETMEAWKMEHGRPPSDDPIGDLFGENIDWARYTKDEIRAMVRDLPPWRCAGPGYDPIMLWYKMDVPDKCHPLYSAWLIKFCIAHNNPYWHTSINQEALLLDKASMIAGSLRTKELEPLARAKMKQNDNLGEHNKGAKENVDKKVAQVHKEANRLLYQEMRKKSEIIGVLKRKMGIPDTTLRTYMKTHPSGLWKK